jgi:hypothetical protein
VPEVVVHLEAGPEGGMGAEGVGQAQGHVRGDAGAGVEGAREGGAGGPEPLRGFGAFHGAKVLAEDLSGMGRVVHRQVWLV